MIAGTCWNCEAHKENVYGLCSTCGRFPILPIYGPHLEHVMGFAEQEFYRHDIANGISPLVAYEFILDARLFSAGKL